MVGKSTQQLLSRAIELHRQGQLEKAAGLYRRLLRELPRQPQALRNLGAILLGQGDHRAAAEVLGRAIAAGVDDHVTHYNHALSLQELGEFEAAVSGYERALSLEPRLVQAHYNRANALLAAGRHPAAVAGYESALAEQPAHTGAWRNRGEALLALRRWAEAAASFEQAARLAPEFAAAHAGLGSALLSLRQYAAAEHSLRRAITLDDSDARALCNLGTALVELGQPEAAVPAYARALALSPGYPFLEGQLLLTKLRVSDWSGFEEHCARIRAGLAAGEPVTPPFAVLAISDSTEAHSRAARLWADAWFPPDHSLGPHRDRPPGSRIRVGYFSADFHEHATMHLMAEFFELHDRTRFEPYAFSFGPDTQDAMRARIAGCFERFMDVRAMGDREIAGLAREVGIDIAVDLKGYTTDARPGIFACRAAPVQASYLGYPGSTSSGYIDYLIADRTVITAEAEAHYDEEIIFLPGSYQVNDGTRTVSGSDATRADLGLPESAVVLCSFNNNYKITPAMFDLWCRILRASEGSCLWLLASTPAAEANLLREARARGVGEDRLVFARKLPHAEHLGRLRAADLFLDTFPCNAHTTASDALRAGLPVLTLAGESFASRVAASLLRAVDVPELVTFSVEDYERTALELIADTHRLRALRARLAENRENSALLDTRSFVPGFESALVTMHDRHRSRASRQPVV